MGDILFIRVSAETYKDDAVEKAWPSLYYLVYGDTYTAKKSSVTGGALTRKRGVLELIKDVSDLYHFGDADKQITTTLEPFIGHLTTLVKELEKHLGERNAQAAHTLTYTIEEALAVTEKAIKPLVSTK